MLFIKIIILIIFAMIIGSCVFSKRADDWLKKYEKDFENNK